MKLQSFQSSSFPENWVGRPADLNSNGVAIVSVDKAVCATKDHATKDLRSATMLDTTCLMQRNCLSLFVFARYNHLVLTELDSRALFGPHVATDTRTLLLPRVLTHRGSGDYNC